MTPDVPLEIQWFVYALVDNEVMSVEDGQALWESLDKTEDVGVFAETVLEQLCETLSPEDQEAWTAQIQTLLNYACDQAENGYSPFAEYEEESEDDGEDADDDEAEVPEYNEYMTAAPG